MTTANRDQFIGRTLDGRYRVRARIARGGMGTVYLGDDLRLSRKIAIKLMHPHLVDDAAFLRRFEKEAQAAAGLQNPNVVNVFDQGRDNGVPYLVMEYVPGITLRELLKKQKRLTAAQAIEISYGVLSGLAAAHSAGFIHRDVKPENVFLADDGRIKIGDFGLARPADNNTTTGQALLGTIAYLSPELVSRGVADARADVYAFGIMLYEMLTGVQPFRGEEAINVAYKHVYEDVPKPSLISAESTPELDELVRWTTLRDANQRPKDAKIVLTRLQHLLEGGLDGPTKVAPRGGETAATTRVLQGATAATTVLPGGAAPAPVTPGGIVPGGAVPGAGQAPLGAAAGAVPLPEAPSVQTTDPGHSSTADNLPQLPATPIDRAQAAARKRARRGRTLTFVVAATTALIFLVSYWFGQGTGSMVAVPNVVGQPLAQATAAMKKQGFQVTSGKCHSPEVPPGSVTSTEPATNQLVKPGSAIKICES
ncbi:MAG: protein kinase, partial [Microbacteriaceae bacterium]|nr:protein kinase [Microbacteriaceae bacterium]